jgi:MFS transporter, SP family, general alpha glucoside:H+ symporter
MDSTHSRQDSQKGQGVPMESLALSSSKSNDETQMMRPDSSSPLTGAIIATEVEIAAPDPEEKLRLGQAIKRYPKFVGYCLGLTIAIIGWGYDLTVVGSIIGVDSFQKDYGSIYNGDLIIPSSWLAAWQAATPLGMAFGSLFGGWFQDRVGRRISLMTGSAVAAVGVTIIFFSYLPANQDSTRAMFFVGKLIQGFAVGILKVTATTYISENSPTAMRGSALALFPTANLSGQLFGSIVIFAVNGVEGKAGYLAAFGAQWPLAAAPFILSFFIPESPSYLLMKGQDEKAAAMAKRLYAPRADPQILLQTMKASIEEDREVTANASFLACFNHANHRRTWIAILGNLYPALFGLELISRSSYFLQLLGMKSSLSLMLLIGGVVVGIISNSIGIWVLSRVGRRKAAMTSLLVSILLWTAIGIAGIWTGLTVAYFVAAALVTIIIVCGMGVWPAAYAIMGEVSSLAMRAKTQAIGGVVQQGSSAVMSVVLPYVYNPDAGNLGAKTGFLYIGLCALGVALTWFFVPEMKGRTVREIDHMFNLQVPAREFKRWRMPDESS